MATRIRRRHSNDALKVDGGPPKGDTVPLDLQVRISEQSSKSRLSETSRDSGATETSPGRNAGDGTGTSFRQSIAWSMRHTLSQNSIQIMANSRFDTERRSLGLETACQALEADYPMVDTAKNRVPRGKVVLWSLPFYGWFASKYMKSSYMRLFYVDDYPKASLGYIALFAVLAVIVDAFTDPKMANVTDRARFARWGRRAPFVLCGGFLTFVTFTGSYLPVSPGLGASLWYGAFHIMSRLSDTVLLISLEAWGLDMTPSGQERDKIWAFREFMLIVGVVFGVVLPARVANLFGADCFANPDDFCWGLPLVGSTFGLTCFLSSLLWVCIAEERSCDRLPEPSQEKWSDESIVPMLISTWCNRPFRFIIASEVAEAFGYNMPFAILPFYIRIVLGSKCMDPVQMLSAVGSCNLLSRLLALPLWAKAADRCGAFNTLLFHNFLLAATHVPFVFVGQDSETCSQFYLLLVLASVWGAVFSGYYLLRSVTSSIADYDTFITGRHRGAQCMMVTGFLPKFWEAFAESLPILMLAYFGYVRPTKDEPDPEQPWKVIALGRVSVSLVPACFILCGSILMCGFPKDARSKASHRDLLAAITNKHALGKDAQDPWYPSRVLPPPPAPGLYTGVLSYFFNFELRRAVIVRGETNRIAEQPAYDELMRVPKYTVGLGLFLALPGIGFVVWGWNDLSNDLGASASVPGAIGLGFALLLVWFGASRIEAAKEVKRLSVPLEDMVMHFNYMCRFTCEDPLHIGGKLSAGCPIGSTLSDIKETEDGTGSATPTPSPSRNLLLKL